LDSQTASSVAPRQDAPVSPDPATGAASARTSDGILPSVTSVRVPGLLEKVEGDPIYKFWVPIVKKSFLRAAQVRGDFIRPMRIASLFGGMSSERKVLEVCQVRYTTLFDCDLKPAAVNFSMSNFRLPPDHHSVHTKLLFGFFLAQ
jgi:hypothetical protein